MKRLNAPDNPGDIKLRMGVFGKAGTGKSSFLHTFHTDPRTGPLFVMDRWGNWEHILEKDPTIYVAQIAKWDDIDLVVDFFSRKQPEKHSLRKMLDIPEDVTFGTLGIDTMTEMQKLFVYHMSNWTDGSGLDGLTSPSLSDYKDINLKTVALVGELINLPIKNLVLIFQERTVLNVEAGTTFSRPGLMGNVAQDDVPGYLRLISYTEKRRANVDGKIELVYSMDWRTFSTDAWTKNQYVGLEGIAGIKSNPSVTKILDQIENYYKEKINND